MTDLLRTTCGLLLAGAVLLSGCGKKEEQPSRLNRTLGGSAIGAPLSPGPIDEGLLRDPSSYKPADYEPLEPAPVAGGAGGGDAGPEAEAVKTVVRDMVDAIFTRDVDGVLYGFVPSDVEALTADEFMSTAYELSDTVDALIAVLKDKGTGPEFEQTWEFLGMVADLAEPLGNSVTVAILDEENAVATINMEQVEFPQELDDAIASMLQSATAMAAMMSGGGAAGEEGAGETPAAPPMPGMPMGEIPAEMLSPDVLMQGLKTAQIPLPLRKIDEDWKLALPEPIAAEDAELLRELLEIFKNVAAATTQRVDQVETLDAQMFLQITNQAFMPQLGPIMGWAGRAQALALERAENAEAAPDDQGGDPNDSAESDGP
jgi:hypothetical protein